jgi:hypothetical protein
LELALKVVAPDELDRATCTDEGNVPAVMLQGTGLGVNVKVPAPVPEHEPTQNVTGIVNCGLPAGVTVIVPVLVEGFPRPSELAVTVMPF